MEAVHGKTVARQRRGCDELLQRVLPQASAEDLFWSYHFLTGALTLTLSDTGRLDRLSNGLCRSADIDSIAPRMIEYCAAGFRAVCRRGSAVPRLFNAGR